jgi:hypothetical protein
MAGAGVRGASALSFRAQMALVTVAAPLAVFLLVAAPYLLKHHFTYKNAYLLEPPPPIGGPRALGSAARTNLRSVRPDQPDD